MPDTAMQLLDRDRYFAGKSWKPGHETMEGETGAHHNELSKSGKREGGSGGGKVEYMLPCKTTLSANAKAVKAANTSQYRSTWNPSAWTYQKTLLSTTGNHMHSLMLTLLNCIVHLHQETS